MDKKVCIFGSYKDIAQKEDIVKLGKMLAENGFTTISGGFGGTMEDVSKGAKSADGKTIGVTYYKWKDKACKGANKYIDKEIETKDIFERIAKMMELSDAFIVLPGGTGTLLELSAVLEYINKGLSAPKPIIAYGSFWRSVVETASDCDKLVNFIDSIEDIVAKLTNLLT